MGTKINLTMLLRPARSARGLHVYLKTFGAIGLLHALHCFLSNREKVVSVSARWSKTPIYLRLNTSDVTVFRQVFIEKEYDIIKHIRSPPGAIIDGGANIGLTSIFMAQLFPDIRIYAIEPEEENLELAKINTRAYTNIELVRGALWNGDMPVSILSHDVEHCSFRIHKPIKQTSQCLIKGIRMSTLMQDFGIDKLWLLKLDVEGAEYEVLSDHDSWISRVDNIVAELHDRIRVGCEAQFVAATSGFDIVARSRELVLACRPTLDS